ncbi:Endoplasmic reticulum resident protein 44 [Parelaphostrongylus tenuis]|uniref:Endoplasmic reticulum resident protein 44 n=1 Tax=Parelaphostrongylus tenuis TaxID=148309 RepID=A0AAD5R1Z4_PARTN|nr:Endoplasmic reticulum resident protein 44 [Parelaphostrongylus tenuis]
MNERMMKLISSKFGVLILRANGKPTPLEEFIILDVNDQSQYAKEHIIAAEYFNRFTLSRNHFETPLLATARLEKRTLVIYGESANTVTSILHQRGYKAVYLSGTIPYFKTFYPKGLTTKSGNTMDFAALEEALRRKIDSNRGGRLWRSTSSSRLRSVDTKDNSSLSASTKKIKIPWK